MLLYSYLTIGLGLFLAIICTSKAFGYGETGNAETFIRSNIMKELKHCYFVKITNYRQQSKEYFERQELVPSITVELNSLHFVQKQSIFKMLGVNQIIRHQAQCVIFHVDLSITTLSEEINKISKLFTFPNLQPQAFHTYIIFSHQTNSVITKELILHNNLKNFPKRIWVKSDSQGNAISINHFCYYCNQDGPGLIESRLDRIFPDITRNLNKHTLRCTAPPAPPLVNIVTRNGTLQIEGMQEVILKSMASTLNFTFTLKKATGGLTGSKLPNGLWTGIMGEIQRNEADIGISVATSYERNKDFEFTVPVYNAFLVLVSTKSLPFFDWEAIFYPFKLKAWFAIMGTTIIYIWGYRFLHNQARLLENKSKEPLKRVSLFTSAYLTVGALIEQGVPLSRSLTPSRTLAGFWFLFAIVVTCAYKSKLFLFLTFPVTEKPPSTFHELSTSDYHYGLKSLGGVGLQFITNSPVSYVREIGTHLEISTDKYSCLDKTVTSRFVCIIYRAYIDFMMELRYWKIKHKFFISDYLTPPVGASWVLPKHSPILPILDKLQINTFEMGLANKYVDDYTQGIAKNYRILARKPNATVDTFPYALNYVPENDGPKSLKNQNLYGAFFILLFGVGLGIVSFGIEVYGYKYGWNWNWKMRLGLNRNTESILPLQIKIKSIRANLRARADKPRGPRAPLGGAFGLIPRKRKWILVPVPVAVKAEF